jgi:hypothetical protein
MGVAICICGLFGVVTHVAMIGNRTPLHKAA